MDTKIDTQLRASLACLGALSGLAGALVLLCDTSVSACGAALLSLACASLALWQRGRLPRSAAQPSVPEPPPPNFQYDESAEHSRRIAELEESLREKTEELEGRTAVLTVEMLQKRRAQELLSQRTQELAVLNDKLERSNKELEDFAYIASHDLKEPLRGIHNYSAILVEDYSSKLDEEGQRRLQTLMSLCQRMEALIDSLLQYSRVGQVELAMVESDLDQMVNEVIESLQITLTASNTEIKRPQPLPTITCDKVRIAEVFRNLVTNAMKYNDKPQRWIEIGCQKATAAAKQRQDTPWAKLAEDTNVFYVRDNGIGIQAKHLDSIFRIFKRLHGRDKYGGGTGIGLTIVKTIVERHGGHIWVESTYGEGTAFYFTIGEARG